jgi:hypothetical protein
MKLANGKSPLITDASGDANLSLFKKIRLFQNFSFETASNMRLIAGE